MVYDFYMVPMLYFSRCTFHMIRQYSNIIKVITSKHLLCVIIIYYTNWKKKSFDPIHLVKKKIII